MKIYTKTGDEGQTGLFGGPRVGKDSARIEAYGTVDELNAVLGVARSQELPMQGFESGADADGLDVDAILKRIQDDLFTLGADLATPHDAKPAVPRISANKTAQLEGEIDSMETTLEPLKEFILPGGTPSAATIHLARTVCRRAERRAVTLAKAETINEEVIRYLNRLSDHLFVFARYMNARQGRDDEKWRKESAP